MNKSSAMFVVEGEVCHEAVLKWYHGDSSVTNSRELSLKAKKHLSAMGWVFWYAPKKGRQELRYQSPKGKVYYSLRMACKSYIEEAVRERTLVAREMESKQSTEGKSAGGERTVADRVLESKQPTKRKSAWGEGTVVDRVLESKQPTKRSAGGEGTVADRVLESKKPTKRKSLTLLENQANDESVHFNPPKRQKKLKKQEYQIKPGRIIRSSKRVRKGPLPNSSHCNRKTILSWLIDNDAVTVLAKVYYRNKAGNPLKKGRVTRNGIQCDCCFRVFTLTAFEAHAGSAIHRPSANIILDDGSGRSISDCLKQVRDSIMIKSYKVESPQTVKDTSFQRECDEVCSACRHGGEIICCDHCPSAFHANCLGLKEVPNGDWFCPSCCCGICSIGYSTNDNFLACQQCERKFHVGCLGLKESNDLNNYQTGINWFCSHSCEKIFSSLRKLTGKPIPMGNNLTWTLLKPDACSDSYKDNVHALEASAENHSKLRVALDVMHECFEPSKDVYTGRDIVEDVIFSRVSKLKRLNFKGFYTVILEENDELVSVATVRVYGDRVAEMPLVATRFRHRRRGMCRVLVEELEKNLRKFGVQKLILPAVPSVVDTWTDNFGFSHMTDDERSELLQYTFLDFQGTILCQKLLDGSVID
ncbi:hypothetical protein DITRI_Ditri10aG0053200 [Diplodiscus trichospermus]